MLICWGVGLCFMFEVAIDARDFEFLCSSCFWLPSWMMALPTCSALKESLQISILTLQLPALSLFQARPHSASSNVSKLSWKCSWLQRHLLLVSKCDSLFRDFSSLMSPRKVTDFWFVLLYLVIKRRVTASKVFPHQSWN